MPNSKKISRLFLLLNFFVAGGYLLACTVPFLNPGKFWIIALLGLVFPLLLVVVIIFLAGWLLVRSKWSLISAIALLLSWQQLSVTFSWHMPQPFLSTKAASTLRIFQWNVSSWDEINKVKKGGTSYRPLMFEEVKKSQADVLCFEEFFETKDAPFYNPTIPELEKMGYPYHYYVATHPELKNSEWGIVIFSKYPITNKGIFDFEDPFSVQQLIYADINFNGQPIRVFAIHLQSVHFGKNEYVSLDEIKHRQKSGLKDSRTIVGKLKRGYEARSTQADTVDSFVKESPYPVLLCGDFNDVPNSYTYFTIKGNLQDAFLKEGNGIGRTFRFISPTLRIDYIFADKKFTVNQYHRLLVPYSDHYGIMADVTLNGQ